MLLMLLRTMLVLTDWYLLVLPRIVQPLEDLPRVKRAKIQFTIEKPSSEAEEVPIRLFLALSTSTS